MKIKATCKPYLINPMTTTTENTYEKFHEWLNSCPVEITNYQDFSDQLEITFKVPLEKED